MAVCKEKGMVYNSFNLQFALCVAESFGNLPAQGTQRSEFNIYLVAFTAALAVIL